MAYLILAVELRILTLAGWKNWMMADMIIN